MPNWLRALIAGYGAKKLGGGCLSTILIFFVLYWLLGQHCQSESFVGFGSFKKSVCGETDCKIHKLGNIDMFAATKDMQSALSLKPGAGDASCA